MVQPNEEDGVTGEPKTAYVVTQGEYSDYSIIGVFLTREEAEAFTGGYDRDDPCGWYGIEEYPIGGPEGVRIRTVYWCRINLKDGQIPRTGESVQLFDSSERATTIRGPNYDWEIIVESAVSKDHAIKVAIEARQKWLREKTPVPEKPLGLSAMDALVAQHIKSVLGIQQPKE